MDTPVFGFLAFTSGSFEGAIIRDMRLANELHRRGFKVVIYWMMERNRELVDKGIRQRMLCNGMRYQFRRPSGIFERIGRILSVFPARLRREFMQRRPDYVDQLMGNYVRSLCDGPESDPRLVSRLERFMAEDGVTHLLPTFAMACPFAQAAKVRGKYAFDYLVTFQGEEIFANYAQRLGRLEEYHRRLRETVGGSGFPAIAVSRDYILRLRDEMGIDESRMRAIYPGIEWPAEEEVPAFEVLAPKFPKLTRDLPIVTYIGRQDSEKGIDLLLYATKMLQEKGIRMQLVICGGTSFGQRYRDVLKHIAEHLRVPVHHRRRIPGQMRDALYHYSRCIVYPSIHREPFGLVAAEAMSRGTPVLVPDIGGITEAICWNGRAGGLTFRSWDSADLARQLERLLADDALHAELAANTRPVAANFTVEKMTDQVLEHLGLGVTRL
ncbi:MAG: glycosyltransferase family 4 protein [Tepidisphaeraceae bacterium]|jgi:glycosyltransferase involved in cell wall biosynthesis